MANTLHVTVSVLLLSVAFVTPHALDPYEDPTLKIIREQDRQEGSDRHNNESLQCPSPEADSNTVHVISGEAYHMGCKVKVVCNQGLVLPNGQSNVEITCIPFPHPCMCMAGWQTTMDFKLMYDLNCTAERTSEPWSWSQCYDPTPVNGRLTVLSGTPFVISNITVQISCPHGTSFPDGTTVKNETCLPASTPVHVTGVWVPDSQILTYVLSNRVTTLPQAKAPIDNNAVWPESSSPNDRRLNEIKTHNNEEREPISSDDVGDQVFKTNDVINNQHGEGTITGVEQRSVIINGRYAERSAHKDDLKLAPESVLYNENVVDESTEHSNYEVSQEEREEMEHLIDIRLIEETESEDIYSENELSERKSFQEAAEFAHDEFDSVKVVENREDIIDDTEPEKEEDIITEEDPEEEEHGGNIENESEEHAYTEEHEEEEPDEEQVWETEEEEKDEAEEEIELEVSTTPYPEMSIESPNMYTYREGDEVGSTVEEEEVEEQKKLEKDTEPGQQTEEVVEEEEEVDEEEEQYNEQETGQEREEGEEQEATELNTEPEHETEEVEEEEYDEEPERYDEQETEQEEEEREEEIEEEEETFGEKETNDGEITDDEQTYGGKYGIEEEVEDTEAERNDVEVEEEDEEVEEEDEQSEPVTVEMPGPLVEMEISPQPGTEDIPVPRLEDPENICSLPVQSGFCKAYFQRYFYNPRTSECESFVYGGCGGNKNNFESHKECMQQCLSKPYLW